MKFPLLSKDEFISRIIEDFKQIFPVVNKERDYLYVEDGLTNMSIPFSSIYREYCSTKDYNQTLETYVQIARKILSQYKFQINYKNVYPILKHESFGVENVEFSFYRKPLFTDIHQLYVSDEGEVFRYLLESDHFDKDKMEKAAMENLNKMANLLTRLDEAYDIYTLRYTSDYGATLLLTESIQKQIHKHEGKDYLFCIPFSSLLIVAKNYAPYIHIMNSLMLMDEDSNKISTNIYRCNHGVCFVVDQDDTHLKIIK